MLKVSDQSIKSTFWNYLLDYFSYYHFLLQLEAFLVHFRNATCNWVDCTVILRSKTTSIRAPKIITLSNSEICPVENLMQHWAFCVRYSTNELLVRFNENALKLNKNLLKWSNAGLKGFCPQPKYICILPSLH